MRVRSGRGASTVVPPSPAEEKNQQRWPQVSLDQLLEALPAAVYTTDDDGRITYYNRAAADLWGCEPELGKSEWCGSWRLCWPDGRPMAQDECPMAIALKEARPIRGTEAIAERPDGVRIPFLAYMTPLFDEVGTLTGAINTLFDTRSSEPTQAEIAVRKQTERAARQLAAIVESSDDAIVSKDLNGIVASWNKAAERLFGYSAEEVIGKSITLLIPTERLAEEDEILRRIGRGERVEHFETVRRCKDGRTVDVSLVISPIVDRKGKVIGASKIARDITARRRIEAIQAAYRKVLELTVRDAPFAEVFKLLVETIETQDQGMLGSILLVKGGSLRHGATPSLPNEYNATVDGIGIGPSAGSSEAAPVGVSDVAGERWVNFRDLALDHGPCACWSTPIVSGTDELLGTFAIYYKEPRQPLPEELALVNFVTQSAALAIERRRAREKQSLLLREMNHRIKNLFAVTSGIVGMSARGAESPEDMAETVRARLGALARAHDLIRPGLEANGEQTYSSATLLDLVRTVMSPYLDGTGVSDERVAFSGSDVPVGTAAATSMALVLHELATNAAKYGALSSPSGRVQISWLIEQKNFSLEWREENGPTVRGPPSHTGFGNQLSRHAIEGQLGGRVAYDWRPQGLVVKLIIPVEHLSR